MKTTAVLTLSSALGCGMLCGWGLWKTIAEASTTNRASSAFSSPSAVQAASSGKAPTSGNAPSASVSGAFRGLSDPPKWRPELSASENELAMYEALEAATVEQLETWLDGEFRIPPGYSASTELRAWEATRQAMLDRLLERNPVAFVRWVSRIPQGHRQDSWIRNGLRGLGERPCLENAAALASLKAAFPDRFEQESLILLAETDPAAALAQWKTDNSYDFPAACSDLLAREPEKALAFVAGKPSSLWAVCGAFRRQGPEALEAFAAKLPEAAENTSFAWAMAAEERAKHLQPGDGAGFAAFVKEHGVKSFGTEMIRELPDGVAGEILTALKGETKLQARLLAALASSKPAEAARLFTSDPEAAAAVASLPRDPMSAAAPFLQALAASWSLEDSAALRDWARALPETLQSAVIPELAFGFAGKEFMDFTRGAPLPDDNGRLASLGSMAAREMESSAKLLDWLASFPPDKREKLTQATIGNLAAKDPAAAAALAAEHPDQTKRESLIVQAGNSGAFPDAQAVLKWGADLPADLRVSGLTAAFGQLAEVDSGFPAAGLTEAAAALINSQTPETLPAWKALASNTVEAVGRQDPAQAEAFWTSLPEPLRESSADAFAYALGSHFREGEDPLSVVEELRRVQNPELRRSVAKRMGEEAPGFSQFNQTQIDALIAQLKDLSR